MYERQGERAVLSHAGDVNCPDAYIGLQADADAVLVDVRTSAEWNYVGHPDLTQIGKRAIFLEWQRLPDGTTNGRFVEQLHEAGVCLGVPIYFLCRSGVRSAAAAKARDGGGSRTRVQRL